MPKANSSAPRIAARTMSRPVLSCPSVCSRTRPAQVVHHERLVSFGNAKFERQPRMFDRTDADWRRCRRRSR